MSSEMTDLGIRRLDLLKISRVSVKIFALMFPNIFIEGVEMAQAASVVFQRLISCYLRCFPMSPDVTPIPHKAARFHLFLHYKRCCCLVSGFPVYRCCNSFTQRQQFSRFLLAEVCNEVKLCIQISSDKLTYCNKYIMERF